jgi:hypothetical protein
MASIWFRFMSRKAVALLVALVALVALSVALLRPAYGAFAPQARAATASAMSGNPWSAAGHAQQHHGGAASGDRCASAGQDAAARLPAPERGAVLALAAVVPLYPVATSFLPQSAAVRPPPSSASFYIRSARILR